MANPKEPESEEKPQKSLNDKQQVSAHFYMLRMIYTLYMSPYILLVSTGEPGPPDKVYHSRFGIF